MYMYAHMQDQEIDIIGMMEANVEKKDGFGQSLWGKMDESVCMYICMYVCMYVEKKDGCGQNLWGKMDESVCMYVCMYVEKACEARWKNPCVFTVCMYVCSQYFIRATLLIPLV
jgi:hypothetical protein